MTAQRPREINCDASALAPDAQSIDALARLKLIAKRQGMDLQLIGVSAELEALLTFAGLAGAFEIRKE
jgi:hypothetical protein